MCWQQYVPISSKKQVLYYQKQKMSWHYNQVSLPRVNVHTTGWNKQYESGLPTDYWNKKNTTVFHNKMFTDAYENNWLEALAIYLMIFKRCPNKYIDFKHEQKNQQLQIIAHELGVSKNTLISKIKVLQQKGFITFKEVFFRSKVVGTRMYLASNKEISEKYNCLKFGLYINMNNVDTYKKIKYFLKNIPFLSNLNDQKDRCKYHSYFSTLREEINSDMCDYVDPKTYKALLKYESSMKCKPKSKVKNAGLLPNLSLKGIARVTNRKSNTTAQRYKNFLVDNKVVATYKRSQQLCKVESKEHFEYLKYEARSIPKHALYSKQSKIAYVYDSSLFFVTSDKWSMESMDDYYDNNLKSYVEQTITERNAFKDTLRNAIKYNLGTLTHEDRKFVVDNHGRNADHVSMRMAELLSMGFSNGDLVNNSSIQYNGATRVSKGGLDCYFTKSYTFDGLITNGVPIGVVEKKAVK